MTLWYATRAFGVISVVLLGAVMVLGLLTTGRRAPLRGPAFVVTGLHRSLSMLAVAFVALHVITGVVDGYTPLTWLDAVVPFGSFYQPFWTGLGAVALDLMIALIATSLLRARLGLRAWRAVHWLAYACWPVALAHGLGQGTDRGSLLLLVPTGLSVLAVAAAGLLRLGADRRPAPPHPVKHLEGSLR
ncbi:MAG: methionine sulfoxide reductase heme-binding subunit [Streptosporangiaceae bacterium]|jgi:DMSO/TMAO reductase YedYZ heme-binding membrane subunit|nr:Ferric reductase domain protein transrane component domain protein [Streptosporangiaceae bacterium]MDX6434583.1 methionine sulfoxide reductase heme-binding subunit [Streptosporangiaceae bacterium]